MTNIRIINNNNIELDKWDNLVHRFAQGLPYAQSWYLNAVCENWKIIVYKDYEAGFAFQINKKLALPYSLQPFLTQQIGFLGEDITIFNQFLKEIEQKVFYYQYQLNHFNNLDKSLNINTNKINYELNLNQTYTEFYKGYKTNTKRNLKKANKHSISIQTISSLSSEDLDFIETYNKLSFRDKEMLKLKQLIQNASKHQQLLVYKALYKDEIISEIIFIKNKLRAVYLVAVSNDNGLKLKANFSLVDAFIKQNAETDIILDFEGSMIDGIARFYAGFGASKKTYPIIKKISLRKPLKKILQ